MFATDVDGVLTDAGMYYGESGEELKKFNTRDGMGIKLLQAEGVIVAIITGEQTKIVARRAKKLGIVKVFQGVEGQSVRPDPICRKSFLFLSNRWRTWATTSMISGLFRLLGMLRLRQIALTRFVRWSIIFVRKMEARGLFEK